MQQDLYQLRLGLGYNVVRGSRLLAVRKRDIRRRNVLDRLRGVVSSLSVTTTPSSRYTRTASDWRAIC